MTTREKADAAMKTLTTHAKDRRMDMRRQGYPGQRSVCGPGQHHPRDALPRWFPARRAAYAKACGVEMCSSGLREVWMSEKTGICVSREPREPLPRR